MNDINRRNFLSVILVILVIGITGLFALWFFFASGDKQKNDTLNKHQPRYLSSINKFAKQTVLAPMSIATDDNNLYVLDSGNKRFATFSHSEDFQKQVSLLSIAGANSPVGITVDRYQRVYISIIGSLNKIAVFDKTGKFLHFFPQSNTTKTKNASDNNELFGRPVGIFASNNKLFVSDVIDQDIKVFDLTGKLLMKFGHPGSKKAEFLYPNGITVSNDGQIFVSDSNNARIQVFDQKGNFISMFSGPKKDRLALPRGLAFDNNNLLHVVDTLKHKVFVFTKQGKLVYSYGSFGNRGENLSYPNAIAFNGSSEKAYIADKQNNRISIWKP